MKINSIDQNSAISNYLNNSSGVQRKTETTMHISDSVELSEGAQKFSAYVKAAQESMRASGSAEDIKVDEILKQMKSGSYSVSTEDVVNDILSGMPSNG